MSSTTEKPPAKVDSDDDSKGVDPKGDDPKGDDSKGSAPVPSQAATKEDLKPGAKPKSKDDLKSIPMADLQTKLQSSPKGLSQDEAAKRLAQNGPNALKEVKVNPFLKFLTYFWGPIP